MSGTSHTDSPRTVIDALKIELDRLADAEESARLDADVARSKATSIARERKNVAKAMRLLTGTSSESLTKMTLKALLAQALAKGPVEDAALRSRLENHLKAKGQSTSGLGLMMSKLRDSYRNEKGLWSLPTPDSGGPQVSAGSEAQ